jgi:formylglycine-generating enzyme required for sulfatase activity
MTVEDLGLELVWVVPGAFTMGSPANEEDREDDETQHRVTLTRGFWLGKHEVTNGEYQAFLKASGYDGRRDADGDYLKHFSGGSKMPTDARHPVVWVSWKNAVAFCKWLTERERAAGRLPAGYEYRLPAEAEWEYACRAGTSTVYSWGNSFGQGNCNAENDKGSNEDKQCAYFAGRGLPVDSTMPVGTFPANAWRLHDMHGNVWEWCLDWYDDNYYGRGLATDPVNTIAASYRVVRGGSWSFSAWGMRSAYRDGGRPGDSSGDLGFRAALAPQSGNR